MMANFILFHDFYYEKVQSMPLIVSTTCKQEQLIYIIDWLIDWFFNSMSTHNRHFMPSG